jgi:two-component system sensor kinase FixL
MVAIEAGMHLNASPATPPGGMPQLRSRILIRRLVLHLALFVALLLLSRMSAAFQTTELRSTPWHPESGLAVAAGLLLGRSAVITTAISIYVSTRLWGWPLPGGWEVISSATRAIIFAGSASAMAPWLLRLSLPSLQSILVFLGFTAAVTAAYAAMRLLILWLSVGIEPSYVLPYTVTLSIGNMLGILTITPLFMITDRTQGLWAYFQRWSIFQWSMLTSLVIVSFVVFAVDEVDEFKFFYLILLPVVAFSVRDGYVAAAFSVLASDLLMMAILYFRDTGSASVTELQFLMLALSITGLLLGAAISDRARAVGDLQISHAQLQESQSALLQASRLSLASEMAAALAHELNQPLSSVRNFVRAVRRKLDAPDIDRQELKEGIDAAVDQVDAAAGLLRSTRQFLERGSAQRLQLEMGSLVARCRELVSPELKKAGIRLDIEDMTYLRPVICNEVQIQQVLLNVIRNAREAISSAGLKNGIITIRGSDSARPGFVEVSIRDSGPGVSDELRPHLFHPLQSSKPEGLGLGLSLCSTIIRAHGGEFHLIDGTHGGACFVFTLPCGRSGVVPA